VPVASAVLVALVWLNHQLIQRGSQIASLGEGTLAALVVVLSGLQISKVRFRSFKNVRLRSRRVFLVAGAILALMGVGLVLQWPSALIFVGLLLAYLSLGIFEEVVFLRRRRAEERQAPSQDANEGRAESDEDVLRELGAYEEAPEDGTSSGASQGRGMGV
jgi:phosphatidylserine synthase